MQWDTPDCCDDIANTPPPECCSNWETLPSTLPVQIDIILECAPLAGGEVVDTIIGTFYTTAFIGEITTANFNLYSFCRLVTLGEILSQSEE